MKFNLLYNIELILLCLCMASCQKDTDLDAGTHVLPPHTYPVEVALTDTVGGSVRAVEHADGKRTFWSDGDKIGVKLSGGGNDAEGINILTADGSASYTSVFWTTAQKSTVSAWYPAQETPISLQDQQRNLAIVLKSVPIETNYREGPLSLVFKHQLAKVRITLKGTFSYLRHTQLSMWGYTHCQFTHGALAPAGTKNYLPMRSMRNMQRTFEINIYPIKIKKGDPVLKLSFWIYEKICTSAIDVNLEPGYVYAFTLDFNRFE